MDQGRLLEALDAVYQATLDPAHWPSAVRQIAGVVDAETCVLLSRGSPRPWWTITAASGVTDAFVDGYNARRSSDDPLLGQCLTANGDGPVIQRIEARTKIDGPLATLFGKAVPVRSGVLIGAASPDGLAIVCARALTNHFGDAEEHVLRALWPHVRRAVSIETALTLGPRAPGTWLQSLLDCWHIGVIGLSANGFHVFTNEAARRIVAKGDGLFVAREGVSTATTHETRQVRESVRRAADGSQTGPEWIKATRPSGARAYELSVYAVPAVNGSELRVIVLVTDPEASMSLDPTALRTLHGLTELESRVAVCLAQGMHVRQLAASLGLSHETARWYGQQVRQKLDAASHADVVRLLTRSVAAIDLRTSKPRGKN
jgi:DNA-binding CsgD family transcriptional regulator/PAS domain-containing protein